MGFFIEHFDGIINLFNSAISINEDFYDEWKLSKSIESFHSIHQSQSLYCIARSHRAKRREIGRICMTFSTYLAISRSHPICSRDLRRCCNKNKRADYRASISYFLFLFFIRSAKEGGIIFASCVSAYFPLIHLCYCKSINAIIINGLEWVAS